MSLDEGNEIKKEDGGAHKSSTESFSDHCLPLSEQYLVASALTLAEAKTSDKLETQDGDQKAPDNEENVIGENLPFLPELGTDCLDSYDNAVVENNAEWLKARCKNFGQIEFDIVPQTSGDDTLDFAGIPLDSKVILQADNTSSVLSQQLTTHADIGATNTQVSNVGAMVSKTVTQYATPYLTLSGTNIADNDVGWETTTTPVMSMQNVPGTNNITLDCQKTVSISENNELNLNLGDIDLNFLKSNLGIKDGVVTLFANDSEVGDVIQQDMQPTQVQILDGQSATVRDITLATAEEIDNINTIQNVVETQVDGIQSENTILVKPDNQTVTVGPAGFTGNLALTTISIATDKMSNSTKILVDTNQGRQLYHLNISDLKKLQNGTALSTGEQKQEASAIPLSVPSYILLSNPDKHEAEAFAHQPVKSLEESVESLTGETSKTTTLFMCDYQGCGKMFQNLAKLTLHSMTHNDQKPFKCSEPDCDWAFSKLYKLKRHMESHKGSKEYQCEECNKKFSTIYNLRTHQKHHDRPCTEECPIEGCGIKFQTRRGLDQHLKTHEGVEKTYKCPHPGCNKLFLSANQLGSHPRVHQVDYQKLVCQFKDCGRQFDKMCRLKQHQRMHTGEKPYHCEYEGCKWAFSTASKLTRHMTRHTNSRKWVCNECGKAFMRSEHLKGHMITHTGIKPFICPVEECGQKFVSKSSVYVHLKKHKRQDKKKLEGWSEQDITYHCPMESCDKKYNTKAKLRSHILRHFPDTLKPEDAAQIDIIPLLHEGVGAKETIIEPATLNVKTGQNGNLMTVDPVEYVATTVDTDTGATTTAMHSQFTAELTTELSALSQPVTQAKAKKDNEKMTSARTDFDSNLMLSERARKRRKLLRDKAAGTATEETIVQQTAIPSSELDSPSAPETENLRSHGITFRDPETGVLYVQMQLLQDDPPHPDLYSDEHVLNTQLELPTVITDPASQSHEFVGSTINLQDLVG